MKNTLQRLAAVGILLIASTGIVFAQSNERIDELLNQEPAQLGHAAYLVLSAAGDLDEGASPSQAIRVAQESGILPNRAEASDAATFGAFAYLLTESFDIPGGVLYRIFPGPRYAAREVVFQGWSRTRRAAREPISGEVVTRILSVYLNEEGAAQ